MSRKKDISLMRKTIVAGNWKMNKTPSEAKALIEELKPLVASETSDVVFCVPAIDIPAAIEAADVVFMNSEMKAIPEAVSIAKMTNSISWQNVVFALAIKIIVMIMGLFGFANMWIAVFADTGVSVLCLLNSIRILHRK